MPALVYAGSSHVLGENESVLECLERNGHAIPNSCRSGVCHSCIMRAAAGALPPESQKGLSEARRLQGYFLSCRCVPDTDLEVSRAEDANERFSAQVDVLAPLNERVLRVVLRTEQTFAYYPGQFVNLIRADGLLRSFSLASVPALEHTLELHIALVPGGKMSGWFHREVSPGSPIEIAGPLGNCFYLPGNTQQPILLLGTGTGLAPLYGILRDALHQGHLGPIHLFHGALRPGDLYLTEELRALEKLWPNFTYHACVRDEAGEPWMRAGAVDETALGDFPNLKGWKVFLCGNPDLVKQVQRKAFMAGASMQDIHADAFLPAKSSIPPTPGAPG